jgi:4-amino-4-deoxy-L-arabinose transferase-like glycosyltransferase
VLLHGLLLLRLPVGLESMIIWTILAVPGALLLRLLCPAEHDRLTLAFLMLGGSLILPAMLLLLIQALPGAVPGWLLLVVCDVLTLGLGVVTLSPASSPIRTLLGTSGQGLTQRRKDAKDRAGEERPQWADYTLILILLIAAFFRFAYLGNAEFQGDEGQPMIMAAGMLQGHDDILLTHRKGPLEILLPSVPMVLTERINEWGARFPFAVAGLLTLLGGYLLAARMFRSAAVGLLATAILSLDGFLIGFSRIVQYQNVVLLMTIAALWFCWRFYEGGPQHYLTLAAACAAIGLLGHYDGIFGLPAMGWLVLAGGLRRTWSRQQWAHGLRMPLLVGGGLLAAFYIPFVLHEHFALTVEYLVTMRIGERDESGMFFNNLVGYYPLMTFYNTVPQVQALAVLLVGGILLWLLRYGRPRIVGWGLALLLLVSCVVTVWDVQHFQLNNHVNIAVLAFGLPLAGLVVSPATPMPLRTVLIWLSFPFVAESFLIAEPNTHFYTMHMAAAIVIGVAVVQVVRWLLHQQLMWLLSPALVVVVAILLYTLPYTWMIFLKQHPEYKRDFPDSRPNIYLASYGDKSPRGGYFGFPHQDGWKAIGELYRQGILHGHYDSNQKSLMTTWYIRNAQRGGPNPIYYFAVRAKGNLFIPEGYDPFGSVLIDGRRTLDIYTREPMTDRRHYFHLEDYVERFDRQRIDFPIQWQFLEIQPKVMKKPGGAED